MKSLVLLICLAFVGCQSPPIPSALPLAEPEAVPHARVPARIGHYTLGAYLDPDNPNILHQAHRIQRVETEARWELLSDPLMQASDEENALSTETNLVTPAESPPAPPTLDIAATHSVAVEPPALFEGAVVEPDATGLIDLTQSTSDEINPFAVRPISAKSTRELVLNVSGIIRGKVACIVVNGRTLQTGDVIESLRLEHIEPQAAVFRWHDHWLRVPIGPQPIRILINL